MVPHSHLYIPTEEVDSTADNDTTAPTNSAMESRRTTCISFPLETAVACVVHSAASLYICLDAALVIKQGIGAWRGSGQ